MMQEIRRMKNIMPPKREEGNPKVGRCQGDFLLIGRGRYPIRMMDFTIGRDKVTII